MNKTIVILRADPSAEDDPGLAKVLTDTQAFLDDQDARGFVVSLPAGYSLHVVTVED